MMRGPNGGQTSIDTLDCIESGPDSETDTDSDSDSDPDTEGGKKTWMPPTRVPAVLGGLRFRGRNHDGGRKSGSDHDSDSEPDPDTEGGKRTWKPPWMPPTRVPVFQRRMTSGGSMRWQEHIVSTPDTLHGAPRLRGTRIPVSLILDNLAAGVSAEELQRQYPTLPADAVSAVLAYAADLARDRIVAIPA